MQLNPQLIRQLRTEKGWTQQQLAEICALSLRTIQRVEVHGIASLETSKALAAAFALDRQKLTLPANAEPAADARAGVPLWVPAVTFLAGVLCGGVLLLQFTP